MILTVEAGGYVDAADAFLTGNRGAAEEHAALLSRLAGLAGMAGDDATATEFAAAYDAAAGEVVAGVADLATAFANLGRLTEQSLANHQQAESRSIVPGGVVPADCTPLPPATYAAVLAGSPPSSFGGDSPALTPAEAWVLDQIEGFVWPDADVDRLREAAAVWRDTAGRLDSLADCAGVAERALTSQRSPEVPIAVAAATDLERIARDLAASCHRVGGHCTTYADAVEAKRAEIRALVQEILQFVVEGVVIGAAIGAITAGAGASAGMASVAARVAALSPRFAAVLTALRALASATAASVRSTHEAVRLSRLRLERFLRVPVRNEAGHLTLGSARWRHGWLARHEHSGGHTLKQHVGKREEELRLRLSSKRPPRFASSFRDQTEAEALLESLLTRRAKQIESWLAGTDRRLRLDDTFQTSTGISVGANGESAVVHGVRVILQRDATMPDGYRIVTGFPQP